MKITIEKWKNGAKAPFLMFFDDSLQSHIKNAIPELLRRNLKGTFYINPGASWFNEREWSKIAKENESVILGNHTYSHKGARNAYEAEYEISMCQKFIKKFNKKPSLTSFMYPGGAPWRIDSSTSAKLLEKYNLIIREKTLMRAAGVHIKSSAELIREAEKAMLSETPNQITFHGVGGDWLSVDLLPFIELLDYLNDNRDLIWVTDHISSHKYKTLFSNTKLIELDNNQNYFSFKLISKSFDKLFLNEELTLSFQIPKGWQKVQIFRNSEKINFRIKKNHVYFDIPPDGSKLKIEKI